MPAAAGASNQISALIDELSRSRDKHLAKTNPKSRLR
jgi:hypothetical protein